MKDTTRTSLNTGATLATAMLNEVCANAPASSVTRTVTGTAAPLSPGVQVKRPVWSMAAPCGAVTSDHFSRSVPASRAAKVSANGVPSVAACVATASSTGTALATTTLKVRAVALAATPLSCTTTVTT